MNADCEAQSNKPKIPHKIPNINVNGISLEPVPVELGKKSSGSGLTSVPYGTDFNPSSSKGHSDELYSAADG